MLWPLLCSMSRELIRTQVDSIIELLNLSPRTQHPLHAGGAASDHLLSGDLRSFSFLSGHSLDWGRSSSFAGYQHSKWI